MVFPVKHKIEHDFYYSVANPQRPYNIFCQWIQSYMRWRRRKGKPDLTEDELLEYMKYAISTKEYHNIRRVDEKWRECSLCNQYFLRADIQEKVIWSGDMSSRCKWCKSKMRWALPRVEIEYCEKRETISVRYYERKWEMMTVKEIRNKEKPNIPLYLLYSRIYLHRTLERAIYTPKRFSQ